MVTRHANLKLLRSFYDGLVHLFVKRRESMKFSVVIFSCYIQAKSSSHNASVSIFVNEKPQIQIREHAGAHAETD